MIKAAMITPNMTLGGAERWIVDLVKHTDPMRVIWTGVAVSGYGGADKRLTSEIAPFVKLYTTKADGKKRPPHALPFCYDDFTLVKARNFRGPIAAAVEGADVIVTWGSPKMKHWFKDIHVPRVLCSHSTLKESNNWDIQGITHLAAVSRAAMGYFVGRKGFDDMPRHILYNGADPKRVISNGEARYRVRAMWGAEDKNIIVGYIGRQTSEKRPYAAAEAVKELGKGFIAVYYGWDKTGRASDPELIDYCKRNIQGRSRFFPPTDNVGDVLSAIDVFMLASEREAFSLGLIEAWLAGKPVVATPVGSVPELEDKYGQLVFRVPRDPTGKDLAEAVRTALEDKDGIVKRAQEVASKEFTVQAMARRWEDYLEWVVRPKV